MFENMVLRRIFGPRRDEVTGEWRRLHNEELNDLYSSANIVRVIKWRRMRWAGHVARMGEERGVYRVLVGKPEGRKPLERPRRRGVDSIRMDLQEVGCGYMDWIGLAYANFYKIPMCLLFCRRPHEACTFISGNFRSECSQVYNYHRLLTWDDVKGLHMDIFKVRCNELNTKIIRTEGLDTIQGYSN